MGLTTVPESKVCLARHLGVKTAKGRDRRKDGKRKFLNDHPLRGEKT